MQERSPLALLWMPPPQLATPAKRTPPVVWSCVAGAAVPMPTLPLESMRMRSVPEEVPMVAPLEKSKLPPDIALRLYVPVSLSKKRLPLLELSVRCRTAIPFAPDSCDTSNLVPALDFPMPTLPVDAISMLLVGAPGRMRNGSRLPPVTSRMKKFASLPAISQVCGEKPPLASCSRRMPGVLPLRPCA